MSRKQPTKPPYYLLTGLLLGLVIGVIIMAFVPITYVEASPRALKEEDKSLYRNAIALAYKKDGDLGRAKVRLALINDKNQAMELVIQGQNLLTQNGADNAMRAKALFAVATAMVQSPAVEPAATAVAGQPQTSSTPVPDFLLTPSATLDPESAVMTATPSLTFTPTERPLTPLATFTPRFTATPLPALGYPFELDKAKQNDVCDPRLPGLLQIEVTDKNNNPVPGVRINIAWKDGEDMFYTGLHPSINLGYADFTMLPETSYSLKVGDLSKTIEKLSAPTCKKDDGTPYSGGLMLYFIQS